MAVIVPSWTSLRRLPNLGARLVPAALLVLASVTASACASSSDSVGSSVPQSTEGLIPITVYKSPTCGCCTAWEEYLRKHGFNVTSVKTDDMAAVKDEQGIPDDMQGCHTALLGDYFIEGMVPVEAITKLLEDQPAIDGIALPGMPAGSPGMGGEKDGPFTIYAITDGVATEFVKI